MRSGVTLFGFDPWRIIGVPLMSVWCTAVVVGCICSVLLVHAWVTTGVYVAFW